MLSAERFSPLPCRVLRGHRGSVLTLCCLGGLLLSGGRDNIIRVWDVKAMVCRHTLSGHKDDVLSICGLSIPGPPASSGDLQHLDSQVGKRTAKLYCCNMFTTDRHRGCRQVGAA